MLPPELLGDLDGPEVTPQEMNGATRRVRLDPDSIPKEPDEQEVDNIRASIAARSAQRRAASVREKKRRQRLILISICAAAAIVLIGVIILLISLSNNKTDDDGLIRNNVYAAGVDLSGLTVEEAKEKLLEETENTYSKLDMTVSILDTVITLSPRDTMAQLDVDAVVEAAYQCGRTGSEADAYTVSILPYLNLNTSYIEGVIAGLAEKYSTTLTQTTYAISGNKPSMEQEEYDTGITYQTLTVYVGTAEYGLSTETLYQQIVDAYEINLFEVSCTCTVVAPDPLDYDAVFQEFCTAPVDAVFDPDTYAVTDEIYGYGFTIEELQTAVEGAEYGSTVQVPLHFIEPDITAEFYSDEMFQDTLASYSTSIPTVDGWEENLELMCEIMNGKIIKAGEEFSFNEIIGTPTESQGYVPVGIYQGKSFQQVVGGGASQMASTLYYCALMSDLGILERNTHAYAVSYIQAGFDAEVNFNDLDLRLLNNTEYPILIEATVERGQLKITLLGTESKEHYVRLSYEIKQTFAPATVTTTMLEDNSGGYQDGDILTSGITGYSVTVYVFRYSLSNNTLMEKAILSENYYAKRDQVVVSIYTEPESTEPSTDPSETTQPTTQPEETTNPTETTQPEETTKPSETTQPTTQPEETTQPTETTQPVETTQPEETTQPVETTQPAQTTTPTESTAASDDASQAGQGDSANLTDTPGAGDAT